MHLGLPILGLTGKGASSRVFVGDFDTYATGLTRLIGRRRLLTSYPSTSPLFRVRRSSDNAETDVAGGPSGVVDVVALKAWRDAAGAATLFCVKAYDQTGGGNHFSAPSTATQPSIYTAGALPNETMFVCDNTDDNLLCDVNSASAAVKSFLIYSGDPGTTYPKCLVEYGPSQLIGTGTNALYLQVIVGDANPTEGNLGNTTAGFNYSRGQITSGYNGGLFGVLTPAAGSAATDSMHFWRNGASQTVTALTAGAGNSAGPFTAQKWRIGARSDGSLPAPSHIYAFAEWDADKSANAAAISAIQL